MGLGRFEDTGGREADGERSVREEVKVGFEFGKLNDEGEERLKTCQKILSFLKIGSLGCGVYYWLTVYW